MKLRNLGIHLGPENQYRYWATNNNRSSPVGSEGPLNK